MKQSILVCGVGGPGTVLASKLLAQAALRLGQLNSYRVKNTVLLGVLAGSRRCCLPEEALREALADLPEKYRKLNLDAFELGLRLAQKV